MAIFRDGVKVGNQDFRVGLSKERGQGILRKIGVLPDDKGRKKFEQDARGEIQNIRTMMGMGEGFTRPINFKVRFGMPKGIDQQKYQSGGPRRGAGGYEGANTGAVKSGGLDWKTHLMNNSTTDIFMNRFKAAKAVSKMEYKYGGASEESKLDLYCSKVSIPEKNITTGLYRQAGAAPFPFPTTTVYGALTTTFYCDGTMHIKNYFDAWQKLIYNDLTGNFNYYNEYVADFDVYTRTTMAKGGALKPSPDKNAFEQTSSTFASSSNNLEGASNSDLS